MSENLERREFVKQGLATAGVSLTASARVLGANDRVRLAVIGPGRQGRGVMNRFLQNPEVDLVAVCDVYEPHLELAKKEAKKPDVATYKDFRQVLDRKDVDVVLIGTPDHWHALMTVEACKAGKDVYVEKPASVTVEEGRRMVQAARKYNRIVQLGTQQRSGDHYHEARAVMQKGGIGKVSFVRTWNFGNMAPVGIGNPADGEPPAGLDWEMWLGPAPKRPFNQSRFGVHPERYSSFRWFWDYAGGMMTDWGVHHLDIVHFVMGVDAPKAVTALGGKYALEDNRETPDTIHVVYEYPGFICTYENRECNGQSINNEGYGISFHGTDATLFINRSYFQIFPEGTPEKPRAQAKRVKRQDKGGEPHVRNFLDCVKSRALPISDIEVGHRSSTAALLGNVALRSGKRIVWDKDKEICVGDAQASKFLTREYRKPWKLAV